MMCVLHIGRQPVCVIMCGIFQRWRGKGGGCVHDYARNLFREGGGGAGRVVHDYVRNLAGVGRGGGGGRGRRDLGLVVCMIMYGIVLGEGGGWRGWMFTKWCRSL